MLLEVKEVDRRFYQERLADFLPAKLMDIHTHIWLKSFRLEMPAEVRGQT